MPGKSVTALSAIQYDGSGWIDASGLAGGVVRRVELSASALASTVAEVWASSDNTAAVNYTGAAPPGQRPPTPPGGKLIGTIGGPAGFLLVYPEPAQAPGGQAPAAALANQGAQAFYYNIIRTSADVGAVNAILVGEVSPSPSAGAPILNGFQALGVPMQIGTTDSEPLYLQGTLRTVITAGAPTVPGAVSGEVQIVAASKVQIDATGGDVDLIATGNIVLQPTGGVAINTTGAGPAPSALVDVASTTQGTRAKPRMNTAQRNAIAAPATGLGIYNTDTLQEEDYNGAAWVPVGGGRKASFSASASLTNAAAQFIPPSGPATSLTANLGVLQETPGTLSLLVVAFTGDAANVAGQTAVFQLLLNGAPVAGAVSAALATTAGAHAAVIAFTPVALAVSDILTCEITPSALLTAVLTNVMATVR